MAPPLVQELGGDEGRAVPAHEDERGAGAASGLGRLGEIDHLRHIGQVVTEKPTACGANVSISRQ